MGDKIEEIQILFQERNMRHNGPTSSAQQNDMIEEIAHDFSGVMSQWNDRLVPLTNALPDGSADSLVDAFINGLDGKNTYVDQSATASVNPSYYNTSAGRPNTIYEQLADLYSQMTTIQEDLEGQITGLSISASQVPITDAGSLYTATNVETALAEVRTVVDLLSAGQLDLSAVGQNYLPATTNTWSIGSSTKAVKDVYLAGYLAVATGSPSAKVDVNSDIIRLRTPKTPATAGAPGNQGDICWDNGFIYVCVAANTWKKVAITTW